MNIIRLTSFALMCVLSTAVMAYAIVAYGFMPLGALVDADMRAVLESHRTGIYAHVFASAIALALGPLQFTTRLRNRRISLHRWTGRIYLGIGVLIGGLAGLTCPSTLRGHRRAIGLCLPGDRLVVLRPAGLPRDPRGQGC